MVLIVVAVAYLGLVVIAVWGARPGARLRVAATWLLSAVGVTIFVWALKADSEASDGAIVLAAAGVVVVVTPIGIRRRQTERAWPHVVAGSVGGITQLPSFWRCLPGSTPAVAVSTELVVTDRCFEAPIGALRHRWAEDPS